LLFCSFYFLVLFLLIYFIFFSFSPSLRRRTQIWSPPTNHQLLSSDVNNHDVTTSHEMTDDYNSSTLSSHDSGVSTLSSSGPQDVNLRRRFLAAAAAPRPQTVGPLISRPTQVVSAPCLASVAVVPAARPRLPDPPPEEVPTFTSTAAEDNSAAGKSSGVYMNVMDCLPHGPEYVNMTPDLVAGRSKFSPFYFYFLF
jgi:hypothetical protein